MNRGAYGIEMQDRRCPLCDCDSGAIFYSEDGFNVARCDNCGYMYMNPFPTASGFQKIYNDTYRFGKEDIDKIVNGFEAGTRLLFEDRLNVIKKYKKSGRLLDIGCSYGIFLRLAKESGYSVHGVEISKPVVDYGREKFKLDIREGMLKDEDFPEEYFDIVTMFDVLEHVRDPLEELKAAIRVLKKDGLFLMTTPNVTVHLIKSRVVDLLPFLRYYKGNLPNTPFKANELGMPYHINYVTPYTLKLMLSKAGFTDVEFNLCKHERRYYGRYIRGFLRTLYSLLAKVFLKYFRIYIAAEISVCARKR